MPPYFRKTGAFIALFAFVLTQLGPGHLLFASPETSTPLPALFQLHVPSDLASLENYNPGSGPFLIHIETAHGNYEAQKKTQALLHYLHREYGFKTLLLEGSAAPLEPGLLRFFPGDRGLTMKTADRLAQKALVKGPELFLLEEPDAAGYGIENLSAYRANLDAFRAVLAQRKKTAAFLSELDLQIERLTGPFLGSELRAFLKRREDFESEKTGLAEWLNELGEKAEKHLDLKLEDAAFQMDWPMLVRFFKIREFEARFRRADFEGEKERFLAAGLDAALRAEAETLLNEDSFVLSPVTGQAAEKLIEALPQDFDYARYPNVCLRLGQNIMKSELRPELLYQEMETLTELVTQALAKTAEQKKIAALLADHALLKRLFALELSARDYERLLARGSDARPSGMIRRFFELDKGRRVRALEPSDLDGVETLFDRALEFYRLVKERDGEMTANIAALLKEKKIDKAVVVTGGFHAEPFRDFFTSRGFGYALLSPKIEDAGGREDYVRFMLGNPSPGDRPHSSASKATLESAYVSLAPGALRRHGFDSYRIAAVEIQTGRAVSLSLGRFRSLGAYERAINRTDLARAYGGVSLAYVKGAEGARLRVLFRKPNVRVSVPVSKMQRVREEMKTARTEMRTTQDEEARPEAPQLEQSRRPARSWRDKWHVRLQTARELFFRAWRQLIMRFPEIFSRARTYFRYAAEGQEEKAVRLLRGLARSGASREIAKHLSDLQPEHRRAAALALRLEGKLDALQAGYAAAARSRDSQVYEDALRGLWTLGGSMLVEQVQRKIESDAREAREKALQKELDRIGRMPWQEKWQYRLEDAYEAVMARLRPAAERAAAALREIFHTEERFLRAAREGRQDAAVRALRGFVQKGKAEVLARHLADAEAASRGAAAEALRLEGKTEVLKAGYLAALRSRNPDVSIGAIRGLEQLGDKAVVKELVKELYDEHYTVREEAARVIGLFGDDTLLPDIEEVLSWPLPYAHIASLLALDALGTPKAREIQLRILSQEKPPEEPKAKSPYGTSKPEEPPYPYVFDRYVREIAAGQLGRARYLPAAEALIAAALQPELSESLHKAVSAALDELAIVEPSVKARLLEKKQTQDRALKEKKRTEDAKKLNPAVVGQAIISLDLPEVYLDRLKRVHGRLTNGALVNEIRGGVLRVYRGKEPEQYAGEGATEIRLPGRSQGYRFLYFKYRSLDGKSAAAFDLELKGFLPGPRHYETNGEWTTEKIEIPDNGSDMTYIAVSNLTADIELADFQLYREEKEAAHAELRGVPGSPERTLIRAFLGGVILFSVYQRLMNTLRGEPLRAEAEALSGAPVRFRADEAPLESVMEKKIGTGTPFITERFFREARAAAPQSHGRQLLDAEILETLARKNPRALYLLLSGFERLQEGSRQPLLAVLAQDQAEAARLKDLVKKALSNREARVASRENVDRLAAKLRTGELLEFVVPAQGLSREDTANRYIREHEGGVAYLVLGRPEGIREGAVFGIDRRLNAADWTPLVLAALTMKQAADLIRDLDAGASAAALKQYVADHLPGFQSEDGVFMLRGLAQLVEFQHATREYLAAMA